MKPYAKSLLIVLVLFVIGYSQPAVAGSPNLGVMPINSYPYGKAYGVWGQEFDRWLFQFSLADYPLFQGDGPTDCGVAQSGQVWFLWGVLDGSVTRSCTIPAGKALFISVNSTVSFVPIFGENEEQIREDAQRDLAGIQTLEVTIDGLPLDDPLRYRADSPEGGFVFTIEDGTILAELGYPPGDYYPAVVDGYWIMVRPLSVGEHTIQWASSGEDQYGNSYSYSATWNLTVVAP